MATRTYDRILECGCAYSADGGGGLMPCSYGYGCGKEYDKSWKVNFGFKKIKICGASGICKECKNQEEKCHKAYKEWIKSEDYKIYCKEVEERNK